MDQGGMTRLAFGTLASLIALGALALSMLPARAALPGRNGRIRLRQRPERSEP